MKRAALQQALREYRAFGTLSQETQMQMERAVEAGPCAALPALKAAKKYLEPELNEPGRTVFWQLVDAIKHAEGR